MIKKINIFLILLSLAGYTNIANAITENEIVRMLEYPGSISEKRQIAKEISKMKDEDKYKAIGAVNKAKNNANANKLLKQFKKEEKASNTQNASTTLPVVEFGDADYSQATDAKKKAAAKRKQYYVAAHAEVDGKHYYRLAKYKSSGEINNQVVRYLAIDKNDFKVGDVVKVQSSLSTKNLFKHKYKKSNGRYTNRERKAYTKATKVNVTASSSTSSSSSTSTSTTTTTLPVVDFGSSDYSKATGAKKEAAAKSKQYYVAAHAEVDGKHYYRLAKYKSSGEINNQVVRYLAIDKNDFKVGDVVKVQSSLSTKNLFKQKYKKSNGNYTNRERKAYTKASKVM